MDGIHCPGFSRPGSLAKIVAKLRLHLSLGLLDPDLKAQLVVNPMGSLHTHLPGFAPKQNMHPSSSVSDAGLADIPNAGLNPCLFGEARNESGGRSIHREHPASLPDRCVPLMAKPIYQLALASGPHSIRRIMSCNISRSIERSTINLQSLLFSSSSCFKRRIAGGSIPTYFSSN